MNQIRWLLPPNGFLPSAVIRKGSRMSAKSRKVLFVAIAYTETFKFCNTVLVRRR